MMKNDAFVGSNRLHESEPGHPWYGAERIDPTDTRLADTFARDPDAAARHRGGWVKEIRRDAGSVVDYLHFVARVFPPRAVFNTRDKDAVARWAGGRRWTARK